MPLFAVDCYNQYIRRTAEDTPLPIQCLFAPAGVCHALNPDTVFSSASRVLKQLAYATIPVPGYHHETATYAAFSRRVVGYPDDLCGSVVLTRQVIFVIGGATE